MADKPYKKDTDRLETLWNDMCAKMADGANSEQHDPPALMEASAEIAAGSIRCRGIDDDDVPDDVFSVMVQFGAAMFRFGQFSDRNGLPLENLFACRCNEVTDEHIKAFFEGVTFNPEQ
jgi:hypothetical protein